MFDFQIGEFLESYGGSGKKNWMDGRHQEG